MHTATRALIATAALAMGPGAHAGEQVSLNVYFGDLHLHTVYSNDAYALGAAERTPDGSYRYAKGEPVPTPDGRTARIDTPLDFLAVTDHAEFLGAMQAIGAPGSEYADTELGRILRTPDSGEEAGGFFSGSRGAAFMQFVRAMRSGQIPPGFAIPERERTIWRRIVDDADAHYEPGTFTTFAAYEWTSSLRRSPDAQAGGNMHRNVIFEGTEGLPQPFSAVDSPHPEDLWAYLERQRMRGVDVLAIPHNPNVSDGLMFRGTDSFGEPIDDDYAARRTWNEPLVEVTQQKGTSETHPLLSPNDEFAGFELFTELLLTNIEGQVPGSYVREAYRNGIERAARDGFNPFQFGLAGATDFHNAITSVGEDQTRADPATPETRRNPNLWGGLPRQAFSVAGLTAVWAEENTREAIFAAFRRRETYATTGPRLRVRLFGGWSYAAELQDDHDWASQARAGGVPMGGALEGPASAAPAFAVEALKDASGANLDRIQIVKGWVADGQSHERIYDIALSGGRTVGDDGGVDPVGNTVDVEEATYANTIGATELRTVWRDPDFDPGQHAFYYARVLEIPTPRWTTYDAAARGDEPRDDVPATLQERAFTSPIWYRPGRGD